MADWEAHKAFSITCPRFHCFTQESDSSENLESPVRVLNDDKGKSRIKDALRIKSFSLVEQVNGAYQKLSSDWKTGKGSSSTLNMIKVQYAFELLSNLEKGL